MLRLLPCLVCIVDYLKLRAELHIRFITTVSNLPTPNPVEKTTFIPLDNSFGIFLHSSFLHTLNFYFQVFPSQTLPAGYCFKQSRYFWNPILATIILAFPPDFTLLTKLINSPSQPGLWLNGDQDRASRQDDRLASLLFRYAHLKIVNLPYHPITKPFTLLDALWIFLLGQQWCQKTFSKCLAKHHLC